MEQRKYRIDPENIEPETLLKMTGDLTDKRILEVGCGNGRLTNRYAQQAREVVAIDPDSKAIAAAQETNPLSNVSYFSADILEFADPERFDIVILSWSL